MAGACCDRKSMLSVAMAMAKRGCWGTIVMALDTTIEFVHLTDPLVRHSERRLRRRAQGGEREFFRTLACARVQCQLDMACIASE